jgi:hypothetical protein
MRPFYPVELELLANQELVSSYTLERGDTAHGVFYFFRRKSRET